MHDLLVSCDQGIPSLNFVGNTFLSFHVQGHKKKVTLDIHKLLLSASWVYFFAVPILPLECLAQEH